jgi:hypothetical protein
MAWLMATEGYLLCEQPSLSASLYRLSSNFIGKNGKALIRKALQGKAGFELLF